MVMNSTVRKSILIVLDIILVNSAFYGAFLIRFDGNPGYYLTNFQSNVVYIVLIYILNNVLFGLYRKMWRYASIQELLGIFWASTVSMFLTYVIFWGFGINIPRSILLLTGVLSIFFIGGTRFTYRIVRVNRALQNQEKHKNKLRTLIIGAGDAGANLIKELIHNEHSQFLPIALLDDAEWKQQSSVHNIPIKGNIEQLEHVCSVDEIQQIIIAIPSLSKTRLKEIAQKAKETGVPVKTLPNITDLLSDKISLNQIRDIEITDLLGRDEVQLDISGIRTFIEDKVVLITGGGGSIGSEIVRQLIPYNPKQLLILDIYENNAYDLQQELKRLHPEIKLKVIIASVRDKERLDLIFKEYKPHIVFHAAAHKHVPFMEENPSEAIKNNILGTLNVANCAHEFKATKFILISTDKAVNPTNIMGATKRVAELTIQSLNKESQTEFVAVRFGNVLGSNGSVIPLFKEQIKAGGPVTITHPDITRYFMTIPEASKLVIQAGTMAKGGEIFVLDMGEPVKILDLATQLIELSGFIPNVDIKIETIGLRPGEKLYEELLLEEEGLQATKQEGILIAQAKDISHSDVLKVINHIQTVINSTDDLKTSLKQLVPSIMLTKTNID